MTNLKEWMDAQWRNGGVQYAGHGVVYESGGNSGPPRTRAGTARNYKSKEQKAYEARFQLYNKKLTPIILAEATLTDGVYRWPAHTTPEPIASVPRKQRDGSRRRVPKAKLEQAAAIIAKVPEDELTAFLARFGLSLSLAASIASLGDVEMIARQFLRATL